VPGEEKCRHQVHAAHAFFKNSLVKLRFGAQNQTFKNFDLQVLKTASELLPEVQF